MLTVHDRKYQWRQVQMCLSTSAKTHNIDGNITSGGLMEKPKVLNDGQKRLTECRNSSAETANWTLSTHGTLTLLLLLPGVSFTADLVEIGRFSLGLGRSGSQQAGSGAPKAAPLVRCFKCCCSLCHMSYRTSHHRVFVFLTIWRRQSVKQQGWYELAAAGEWISVLFLTSVFTSF